MSDEQKDVRCVYCHRWVSEHKKGYCEYAIDINAKPEARDSNEAIVAYFCRHGRRLEHINDFDCPVCGDVPQFSDNKVVVKAAEPPATTEHEAKPDEAEFYVPTAEEADAYQEGDLEKFFGCQPPADATSLQAEKINKIRGIIRQLEQEIEALTPV